MQLHGDEQSDEIVWLEGMSTERRYVVTWPHGYTARFSPALELLNERGQELAREGDVLEIEGPSDLERVGVCSIVAVNGRLVAAPVAPATPMLTPRPTNGPPLSPALGSLPTAPGTPTPRVPPPVGFGHVALTVCGDDGLDNEEDGGDPIEFFVVTFHALDGQPDTVVRVQRVAASSARTAYGREATRSR